MIFLIQFVKKGFLEFPIDSKIVNGKAGPTFDWGNWREYFPLKNMYFTYDSVLKSFELRDGLGNADNNSYRYIFRKR